MKYIFKNVCLESMASLLPQESLSSLEIENQLLPIYEQLKLSVGRLELMTGIKNRFIFPKGLRPSTKAIEVGQKVLEQSKIAKDKIDLLINASVCRDFLEPSTAAFIHKGLGLRPACAFMDISNACLGVLQAIFIAALLVEAGQIQSALIVSCENSRPLIEESIKSLNNAQADKALLKKLFSNFTIGSGAFGVIVTHQNNTNPDAPKLHLKGGLQLVDSNSSDLCVGHGDINGLFMQTQSELLLARGVELAKSTYGSFCDLFNMQTKDFDHFVAHQVGTQHRNILYSTLNIPLEKDTSTYETMGNCGSVALPIALCHKLQELKSPNRTQELALLGMGSGLSALMMRLQWNP